MESRWQTSRPCSSVPHGARDLEPFLPPPRPQSRQPSVSDLRAGDSTEQLKEALRAFETRVDSAHHVGDAHVVALPFLSSALVLSDCDLPDSSDPQYPYLSHQGTGPHGLRRPAPLS